MLDKELYTRYFDELKARVTVKNFHRSTPIYGAIHIILAFGCYAIGIFLVPQMSPFFIIPYFYILFIELGYMSHDLAHNQYFQNRKLNNFFLYISANMLVWLSVGWWIQKHNVSHHAHTNSDIHDIDIRDYDEIFTHNEWKIPFFHKHKRVLFWMSSVLVYFVSVWLSYQHIITHRKYGELILSLIFFLLLPYALVIQFGFILGIGILLAISILVWVHLAFVFMVNHIGMQVIDGNTIREYSWLDLQTRTSRNIVWGRIVNHIFGWLNKQIEHHLFPQVSRYHIRAVAKEVQEFCKEKNIQYHEVTFCKALQEIATTLKTGATI